jgi:hypothetical protein
MPSTLASRRSKQTGPNPSQLKIWQSTFSGDTLEITQTMKF